MGGNIVVSIVQLLAALLDWRAQLIGALLVLVVWGVIWWHRRQRAAKKLGMASWYFIAPCLLIAIVAIAAAGYGIGLRSSGIPNVPSQGSDTHLPATSPATASAPVTLPNMPTTFSKGAAERVARAAQLKKLIEDAKTYRARADGAGQQMRVFKLPIPRPARPIISDRTSEFQQTLEMIGEVNKRAYINRPLDFKASPPDLANPLIQAPDEASFGDDAEKRYAYRVMHFYIVNSLRLTDALISDMERELAGLRKSIDNDRTARDYEEALK